MLEPPGAAPVKTWKVCLSACFMPNAKSGNDGIYCLSFLRRSAHRYTQLYSSVVIPTGMPVSSAMDGNSDIDMCLINAISPPIVSPPCAWVPVSLPERRFSPARVYKNERRSVGAIDSSPPRMLRQIDNADDFDADLRDFMIVIYGAAANAYCAYQYALVIDDGQAVGKCD